jgi:hypothetical protein
MNTHARIHSKGAMKNDVFRKSCLGYRSCWWYRYRYCKAFAKEGAKLALVDLSKEALKTAASSIDARDIVLSN